VRAAERHHSGARPHVNRAPNQAKITSLTASQPVFQPRRAHGFSPRRLGRTTRTGPAGGAPFCASTHGGLDVPNRSTSRDLTRRAQSDGRRRPGEALVRSGSHQAKVSKARVEGQVRWVDGCGQPGPVADACDHPGPAGHCASGRCAARGLQTIGHGAPPSRRYSTEPDRSQQPSGASHAEAGHAQATGRGGTGRAWRAPLRSPPLHGAWPLNDLERPPVGRRTEPTDHTPVSAADGDARAPRAEHAPGRTR